LPWPDLPVTVATAINRAETVLASLIPPQGS
jgi:hypothetical protein